MKQTEEWKSVPGWANYSVSNLGQVKNQFGRILKPFRGGPHKVWTVQLRDSGLAVTTGIHRIVAEAFVPIPKDGKNLRVRHKDGNMDNICARNLEWYTPEYLPPPLPKGAQLARKHGRYVGLAAKQAERTMAQKIETMLLRGYKRVTVSKKLGVHPSLVDQIAMQVAERLARENERKL